VFIIIKLNTDSNKILDVFKRAHDYKIEIEEKYERVLNLIENSE